LNEKDESKRWTPCVDYNPEASASVGEFLEKDLSVAESLKEKLLKPLAAQYGSIWSREPGGYDVMFISC
jgi:hypothetical protein